MTEIRRATFADAPDLQRMAFAFIAESGYRTLLTPDADRILTLVAQLLGGGLVLVARAGDQAIGMALATVFTHPMSGERTAAEIAWWVDPAHRGGVVGRQLLEDLEAWARESGATHLQMIAPAQTRVGLLYARRRYVEVETTWQLRLTP